MAVKQAVLSLQAAEGLAQRGQITLEGGKKDKGGLGLIGGAAQNVGQILEIFRQSDLPGVSEPRVNCRWV